MMQIDMQRLVPGFNDPVHDAQRVFRALLDALARPGSIVTMDAALPGNHAMRDALAGRVPLAAFASLLALTDYSTPVWLAHHDDVLGDALRFHAGAPLTQEHAKGAFVYIDDAARMPALDAFATGEPETPEDAATLFIRVPSLTEGDALTWRGPGIEHERTVRVAGLTREFWRQRAAITSQFPCGIDCYFVTGGALLGLPRTTQVEVN